jgi:hypothetical protein
MTCNPCENSFQGYQSVVVSVQKSGSTANLYVQNQGAQHRHDPEDPALLHDNLGGWGMLYLRPPNEDISWIYPSAFLETGITALYYQLNAVNADIVQAQAEYIEIEGRSRSCATSF